MSHNGLNDISHKANNIFYYIISLDILQFHSQCIQDLYTKELIFLGKILRNLRTRNIRFIRKEREGINYITIYKETKQKVCK